MFLLTEIDRDILVLPLHLIVLLYLLLTALFVGFPNFSAKQRSSKTCKLFASDYKLSYIVSGWEC